MSDLDSVFDALTEDEKLEASRLLAVHRSINLYRHLIAPKWYYVMLHLMPDGSGFLTIDDEEVRNKTAVASWGNLSTAVKKMQRLVEEGIVP